MKKIIAIFIALTLFASMATVASARETIPDMLYSGEDMFGNGANDYWGDLGGIENTTWDNGTPKFTQGEASASVLGYYINRVSFFHNFIWEGSMFDPEEYPDKTGIDLSAYKYIEFDVASEYDVYCGSFALCLCGDVISWHGYDAYRSGVTLKAQTWYHVVMPIEEFVYAPCPPGGDPLAHTRAEYGIIDCARMRFEINNATDPDGSKSEELYFYLDNFYGTRTDEPQQKETLIWNNPNKFVVKDGTLTKYTGSETEIAIPNTVTSIADNVFKNDASIKTVSIPDSVTSIGTGNFESIAGLTIYGAKDSYAQTYAAEHSLTFVDITNLKGDVNGDARIGTPDALMALQAAVGKITLTSEQFNRADVDGDGKVATGDALQILQYAVGKIKEFKTVG